MTEKQRILREIERELEEMTEEQKRDVLAYIHETQKGAA